MADGTATMYGISEIFLAHGDVTDIYRNVNSVEMEPQLHTTHKYRIILILVSETLRTDGLTHSPFGLNLRSIFLFCRCR